MNTTDKMAEALPPLPPPHWPRYYQGSVPPGAYTADQMQAYARAALEAEAKPAEPVAWINAANLQGLTLGLYGYAEIYTDESQGRIPLYTAPHRQWQTLSDEEIYGSFRKSGLEAYHQRDAVVQYDYDRRINAFARAVEEKLRAKNSTLACIPAVPPG